MKKVMTMALLFMFAMLTNAQDIELKYFHGKQRCATCMAIEKCTAELIATDYKRNNKEAQVCLDVIDISTANGKKIADDFKVSFSSLYIVKGDIRKDLTRIAFQYARKDPETFKRMLKKEISALIDR